MMLCARLVESAQVRMGERQSAEAPKEVWVLSVEAALNLIRHALQPCKRGQSIGGGEVVAAELAKQGVVERLVVGEACGERPNRVGELGA